MSTAAAGDGDGSGPPPAKKLKNDGDSGGAALPPVEPPMKDLCMKYTKILQSMIDYQELNWEFPKAYAPELYQFSVQNGLTDVSQERFSHAIVFMEESYRDYVRDRGYEAHFSSQYLETRFQLSGKIWGHNGLNNQDQDLVDHDQNILSDQAVNQEQDAMDIAILRALIQFKNDKNGGEKPEADAVNFYEFIVRLPDFHLQIPQDWLVDRILMLEENFNRVEINKLEGDTAELADPTRLEIYNLSRQIWDSEYELNMMFMNMVISDDHAIDEDDRDGQDYLGLGDNIENAGDDEDGSRS